MPYPDKAQLSDPAAPAADDCLEESRFSVPHVPLRGILWIFSLQKFWKQDGTQGSALRVEARRGLTQPSRGRLR